MQKRRGTRLGVTTRVSSTLPLSCSREGRLVLCPGRLRNRVGTSGSSVEGRRGCSVTAGGAVAGSTVIFPIGGRAGRPTARVGIVMIIAAGNARAYPARVAFQTAHPLDVLSKINGNFQKYETQERGSGCAAAGVWLKVGGRGSRYAVAGISAPTPVPLVWSKLGTR